MRVATLSSFDASVAQLQRRQQDLSTAQERLTSGKRVLRASDDPAAAGTAERALAAESRAVSRQRALEASRNAMLLAEDALGEAGELMQQVREQIVAAGNGSYTDAERQLAAASLRSLRDDLLAVANRQDGSGRFIFGGQGSGGLPLVDAPGGVIYAATAGQMQAATGEATALSVDGRAAFLQAPDPANPGASISLFDVIDQVATALETPNQTAAQIATAVSTGIGQVDIVADNLSSWRAETGHALNRIDAVEDRLAQSKLDAQRERSGAEDLDMLSAISDFQNQQTGYDAALKTYSIVQRMSLFDYVK
ncbi:MAG: flagellar hook-associated protein 3 [Rubrivivax sp.]|nr:flagellar hook-associated protein 3 [Rubrivivax sp.]